MTSHSGAKSCMVLNEETVRKVRTDLMKNDARFIISAMKQLGISKQELLKLIEQTWDQSTKKAAVRRKQQLFAYIAC